MINTLLIDSVILPLVTELKCCQAQTLFEAYSLFTSSKSALLMAVQRESG